MDTLVTSTPFADVTYEKGDGVVVLVTMEPVSVVYMTKDERPEPWPSKIVVKNIVVVIPAIREVIATAGEIVVIWTAEPC